MLGAVRSPARVAASVLRYAIATTVCALGLIPLAQMGVIYAATALVGGAWFVWHALQYLWIARSATSENARPMRVFVASNAYLALLFIAVAVDALIT